MRKILAGLVLVLSLSALRADPAYNLNISIKDAKQHPPITKPLFLDHTEKMERVPFLTFHFSSLSLGTPVTSTAESKLYFPISYDAPKRVAPNAAIPMFAKTLTKVDIGWKLTACMESVKDGVAAIRVEAVYTTAMPVPRAAFGEETGPIYGEGAFAKSKLLDNLSISFIPTATTTCFYLFARPGQTYTVPLRQGEEKVNAVVICTAAEPATVAQR